MGKEIKTKDIEILVGKDTYAVWLDMLKDLVPHGRTHRISVVVAAILQCIMTKVDEESKNPVAVALTLAWEGYGTEEAFDPVINIVEKLFQDAKVRSKRTNARDQS